MQIEYPMQIEYSEHAHRNERRLKNQWKSKGNKRTQRNLEVIEGHQRYNHSRESKRTQKKYVMKGRNSKGNQAKTKGIWRKSKEIELERNMAEIKKKLKGMQEECEDTFYNVMFLSYLKRKNSALLEILLKRALDSALRIFIIEARGAPYWLGQARNERKRRRHERLLKGHLMETKGTWRLKEANKRTSKEYKRNMKGYSTKSEGNQNIRSTKENRGTWKELKGKEKEFGGRSMEHNGTWDENSRKMTGTSRKCDRKGIKEITEHPKKL